MHIQDATTSAGTCESRVDALTTLIVDEGVSLADGGCKYSAAMFLSANGVKFDVVARVLDGPNRRRHTDCRMD
ncbi:MAG: hypothetical protein V4754_16200 [Pseudomonadota bacterium]